MKEKRTLDKGIGIAWAKVLALSKASLVKK